ncbi:MAG: hypothetical protein ACQET0_11955 [Pseudomonadota bacterium]
MKPNWLARAAVLVILLLPAGCGTSANVSLMPTPVVYTELGIGPLDAVPVGERWAPRMIYYATTRARNPGWQRIEYGNGEGDMVRLGTALIGFGTEDLEWEDLRQLSAAADRSENEIPLSIAGIVETGRWRASDVSPRLPRPQQPGGDQHRHHADQRAGQGAQQHADRHPGQ